MKQKNINILFLAVLIILLEVLLTGGAKAQTQAKKLQLQLGDSVSIFSEKAYKREKGQLFEAIGNVVIINGVNTLYGEMASFNLKTGQISIEGNVRFISSDLTIYGSQVSFNTITSEVEMENARVVTSDFNIVANKLIRIDKNNFKAIKAQFTTCQDCTESWSIYGERIDIELGQYVQIHHAFAKIKGVSVLYLPYLALPIKTKRESGLLFPTIRSTVDEGLSLFQPYFWNMGIDQDMTFTPKFLGKRGYGLDYQYRKVFSGENFLQIDSFTHKDSIYLPGKLDKTLSDDGYYRNFSHLESRFQFSRSSLLHLDATWIKDTDMLSDFQDDINSHLTGTSPGAYLFYDHLFENFNVNIEADYRKNAIFYDSEKVDTSFVQTMPSLVLNTKPLEIFSSDNDIWGSVLLDSTFNFTHFKQDIYKQSTFLNNVKRLNSNLHLTWNILNLGSLRLKTDYDFNFQNYHFFKEENTNPYYFKYADTLKTQLSLEGYKIYGQAKIEKKRRLKQALSDEDKSLVGTLPALETNEDLDFETIYQSSHRHLQEYKLIHHYIRSSRESGNQGFEDQVRNHDYWFDYDDILKEDFAKVGANESRTRIPQVNTIELQWNHSLVEKRPYIAGAKTLYKYIKKADFRISQGYILDDIEDETETSFKDRLTRLHVMGSYNMSGFNLFLENFYFHQNSKNKLDLSIRKKFEWFSLNTGYSFNSLLDNEVKNLKVGLRFKLFNTFGFSLEEDINLFDSELSRRIYQFDLMPYNNCWNLKLKYRKDIVDERFSLNIIFNFADKDFTNYRKSYNDLSRF